MRIRFLKWPVSEILKFSEFLPGSDTWVEVVHLLIGCSDKHLLNMSVKKNKHSQQTRQSDSLKIMWIVVCVLLRATYFPPGKYLVLLRLKVHIICNKLKSYTNISVSQGQKLKWQSCISEIILSCNKAKTLFSLNENIWQMSPVDLLFSFLHPAACLCDWEIETPRNSCMERVISLPVILKANHCHQEYTSDSLKYSYFTEEKQWFVYRLSSLWQGCQRWGLRWA